MISKEQKEQIVAPVSYTHLDVYKRQEPESMRSSMNCAARRSTSSTGVTIRQS